MDEDDAAPRRPRASSSATSTSLASSSTTRVSSSSSRAKSRRSERSQSRGRDGPGDRQDDRRVRHGSRRASTSSSTSLLTSSEHERSSGRSRSRRSRRGSEAPDDAASVSDRKSRRSRAASSDDRSSRSKSRHSEGRKHRSVSIKSGSSGRSRDASRRENEAADAVEGESSKARRASLRTKSHAESGRGKPSSTKKRGRKTSLKTLEDEDSEESDQDDKDLDDETPGRQGVSRAGATALGSFSLSSALDSLSRELLWRCMTSRVAGPLAEMVTGAGFRALAAQTAGLDDDRLAQRRKEALAQLPADAVVQVRIMGAENLPTWESKNVRAVVRVSMVDASTGEFLSKRKREDDGVNEDEGATRATIGRDANGAAHLSWKTVKCARLCQQVTEPVCISVDSGADSQSLRWDAQTPLLFNVPVKHALDPQAMLFFEILEFGPSLDRHLLRRGDGFRRVAWAFLKLVSATGMPNINLADTADKDTTRLQIYEFPPESWAHRTMETFFERDLLQGSGPRVFNAFRFKERRRLPGHLDVKVGACARPNRTVVGERPRHALESERAEQLPVAELLAGKVISSSGVGMTKGGETHGSNAALLSARRHRTKTEPCLIPTSLVARLDTGTNGCLHVQFSPDGQYLAAACQDGASGFPVRIFAVSTMKLAFTLQGHQSLVYELAWQRPAEEDDPTMLMLASASGDGTVRLWGIPALRDATHKAGAAASSGDEDQNSDDELLGSERPGSRNRRPQQGEVTENRVPKCLHVLQHAPPTYVYAVRFHPSARRPGIVATGGYDGFVRLWDCSTGALLGKLDRGRSHHKSHVNSLCFTNDGNRVISGDGDGVVNVWRLETGRQPANPDAWHLARKLDDPDLRGKAITAVQVHPIERLLLVSAQQNVIRLFELRRYTRIHEGFIGAPVSQSLVRACFSPDGQYVLSGAEDGKPHIWSANTAAPIATKTWRYGFPKPLCAASWHPHEHLVAFCAFNGRFPVLMYEALRDSRDVDAQAIKLNAAALDVDEGDDVLFDDGAAQRRSASETTAQVLSTIREERTRRLSAKLDALDLSDDENTRERSNASAGGDAVSRLKGIDALRERFMQRRLEQQQQQQQYGGRSSNQDSSSEDDEEGKSSSDSDEL